MTRPELQDEYLREMRAQQARAIVLLGAVESPMLSAFREGPTPLIFVNRADPGSAESLFVGIDNAAAGRDVARDAISRGYLRPVVLHAPLTSSATRARVESILATYAEAGHAIAPERVLGPTAKAHLQIGHEGIPPSKAGASNGMPASAQAISSPSVPIAPCGRRTPTGPLPACYGFDDNPLNSWIAPWLSSVRIPYDAYGAAIVAMILGEEAEPRQRILGHALIVRPADAVA